MISRYSKNYDVIGIQWERHSFTLSVNNTRKPCIPKFVFCSLSIDLTDLQKGKFIVTTIQCFLIEQCQAGIAAKTYPAKIYIDLP